VVPARNLSIAMAKENKMAVQPEPCDEINKINGVKFAVGYAGIRKKLRNDVVLIALPETAVTAVTFTTNAFAAAPVQVAKAHLAETSPRFLLINAGCANAGTGATGLADALALCQDLGDIFALPASSVLPFSTGVIGERLPAAFAAYLPLLCQRLGEDDLKSAAEAIMTTDTFPKAYEERRQLADKTLVIQGIAKGAGMIHPNMATMLSFVFTNAALSQSRLDHLWREAVSQSFHCISIDGDTSTNDAAVCVATGEIALTTEEEALFAQDLTKLAQRLAKAIVRDGEGATKFVTLALRGGRDTDECRQVAAAIATSPLVKTALFASDPNWGRLLAAIGRSGLKDLAIEKISMDINGVAIVRHGARADSYQESAGAAAFAESEITIAIDLGRGDAALDYWTCDFSYDYVRINAEYRT
jgi:glutamate N-acetyltransferase/amino-acid N-acetyltransferase